MLDKVDNSYAENAESMKKRKQPPVLSSGYGLIDSHCHLDNHADCGPFYFSVLLEKTEIRIEFLVRSSRNIRCSCIDWATPEQRTFVLDFIDTMIKEEYIMV